MAKRGYCFNTSTIRNCGLSPIEEIQLAGQIGYDGIELWTAEIFRHLSGGGSLDDLRAALDSNGVQAVNLIAFFAWAEPDDLEREAALEEARVVFEMAAALNCPYVAAPPAGVREMSISADDLSAPLQRASKSDRGHGRSAALGVLGRRVHARNPARRAGCSRRAGRSRRADARRCVPYVQIARKRGAVEPSARGAARAVPCERLPEGGRSDVAERQRPRLSWGRRRRPSPTSSAV